jgi:hypothetical protein
MKRNRFSFRAAFLTSKREHCNDDRRRCRTFIRKGLPAAAVMALFVRSLPERDRRLDASGAVDPSVNGSILAYAC